MMFAIILEDENGHTITQLDTELPIEAAVELGRFKLLRYLDPYGNTMFNQLQMEDLLSDLNELSGTVPQFIIKQLVELAEQCKNSVHTYLWFYGD